MLIVVHALPRNDVYLGIVIAEDISVERYPDTFDRMLRTIRSFVARGRIGRRRRIETRCRTRYFAKRIVQAYGRGMPANEHLIRAASDPIIGFLA